jgi:hypothetical protein
MCALEYQQFSIVLHCNVEAKRPSQKETMVFCSFLCYYFDKKSEIDTRDKGSKKTKKRDFALLLSLSIYLLFFPSVVL